MMKKFFTALLTLILVSTVGASVYAEDINYAADIRWRDIGFTPNISTKDGVTSATGITKAWASPGADILPALKTALGEDEELDVIISFEVSLTFTEGNEGELSTAKPILRGANTKAQTYPEPSDWIAAYEEALDGDDTLFTNSNGNVMHYLPGTIELTEDWTLCEYDLTLTKAQIMCDFLSAWNLCIDKYDDISIIKSVNFRNLTITKLDTASSNEKPTEKPAEDDATPTATAQATSKATQQATAQTTEQATPTAEVPATTSGGATDSAVIITCAICAAVIVASVCAAIIVKKRV